MTLLNLAKLTWRSGLPIATDLAMRLAAAGYDVPRLERRFLNT